MNSPAVHRVTLIPMKTTLFSSENSHTFWKKGLTLEIKLGPPFSGPSVSKIIKVGSQMYGASNLCFSENIEGVHPRGAITPSK